MRCNVSAVRPFWPIFAVWAVERVYKLNGSKSEQGEQHRVRAKKMFSPANTILNVNWNKRQALLL
jgi:hypothetical protein